MNPKFYLVTRFKDDDELNERQWDNICNYIHKFGIEKIDDYLEVENNFIKFLKMFYDSISTDARKYNEYGYMASHVVVVDHNFIEDEEYYNLEDNVYERLEKLAKLNLHYVSHEDLIFLLTCWIRGLCLLFLFDIGTGSYLKASDADFCFTLMLHENFEISDIFEPVEHVYLIETIDPSN